MKRWRLIMPEDIVYMRALYKGLIEGALVRNIEVASNDPGIRDRIQGMLLRDRHHIMEVSLRISTVFRPIAVTICHQVDIPEAILQRSLRTETGEHPFPLRRPA